jgi:hypothetical protein
VCGSFLEGRRSLHSEILHAIERHLAAPPVLTVPSLSPAGVERPAQQEQPGKGEPKVPKKLGRPRKGGEKG